MGLQWSTNGLQWSTTRGILIMQCIIRIRKSVIRCITNYNLEGTGPPPPLLPLIPHFTLKRINRFFFKFCFLPSTPKKTFSTRNLEILRELEEKKYDNIVPLWLGLGLTRLPPFCEFICFCD